MSITPSYDFHPYIYNSQITEQNDLVTELPEPTERKCIGILQISIAVVYFFAVVSFFLHEYAMEIFK